MFGFDINMGFIQKRILITSIAISSLVGCSSLERELLYHPTHRQHNNILTPWIKGGKTIGYSRQVESPKNAWLMLHGNAGQAAGRTYVVPHFSENDALYILEYPGYGNREGIPSKESFNQAAKEAYLYLRSLHRIIPVCVAAESIGSGPALSLISLDKKPDKFVLIVPFDKLSSVAEKHAPLIFVSLVLNDNWDNVEALSNYNGPVDIVGAEADRVIPVSHAEALAASYPKSNITVIKGGHNDWSREEKVRIRCP